MGSPAHNRLARAMSDGARSQRLAKKVSWAKTSFPAYIQRACQRNGWAKIA
jgi:hypothetical protein